MESHETTKTVHNAWKMSKSTGRSGSPASVTQKTSNANGDSHSGKNSPSPAPNSPTTSVASAPYSQSWKVVGSPPNRVIHSIPPNSDDQASAGKKSDDDVQEPKLRRPSSTPGTPQRHLNGGSELTSRLLSNASPSKIQQQQPNIVHSNGDAANGKWGAIPGLQWTSASIWNGQNQQGSGSGSKGTSRTSPTPPPPVVANEEVNNNSYERDIGSPPGMGKLPIPVPPNPQYRQQRSLSFSVGQHDTDLFFGYAPPQSRRDSIPYRNTLQSLPLMEEEIDDLPYSGRFRGRSKSSAAAYGIISAHQEVPHAEDVNDYRRDSEYSESGSIWNTQGAHSEGPLLHHRRSMPATSDYPGMWESFNASGPTAAAYLAAMASTTEQDRYEKLRQRRFSVSQATPYGHEYRFMDGTPDLRMMSNRPTIDPAGYAHLAQRRHSVAGPAISLPQTSRYHLPEALENLHISNQPVSYTNETSYPSIPEDVDDYFDNDESRTRAWNELGKGLPLHAIPTHGPLYLVEFKAGRTDLFYVTENSGVVVKKGDLVIVEADRGKDLGKITNDSITPQQVQILQQQAETMNDGHRVNKEIHPKRIYRMAQPAEVTMLVTKNQDEAKAMLVCQTKVRQKKLPMEVVDAEYQWDRRKLTFYFIAERRIDFRELVRDLFKIYKTRIWMCAVNPLMNKTKK